MLQINRHEWEIYVKYVKESQLHNATYEQIGKQYGLTGEEVKAIVDKADKQIKENNLKNIVRGI